MLYAPNNTASDNMVRCERKVHKQKEKTHRISSIYILNFEMYTVRHSLTLNLRIFFLFFLVLQRAFMQSLMQSTMQTLAGQWHSVWPKKKDCRIQFINILDKVPIFPYCAYQV